MSFYYFGSNNYFHSIVLGNLEEYHKSHKNIQIKTTSSNATIIKLLFSDIDVQICSATDINQNDINLEGYFENNTKLNKQIVCRDKYDYKLKNMVCIKYFDEKMGVFLRELILDTFISLEVSIVNLGTVTDVNEQIYLLNNCILFMTTDLDQIMFALNCYTSNISIVVPTIEKNIFKIYHNKFYIINLSDKFSIPEFRMKFLKNNNLLKVINKTNRPFVSCVCPTKNRKEFMPNLIKIFESQTYPSEYRELIILDDSNEDNAEYINSITTNKNVRYYHIKSNKDIPIGKKRNLLNQLVYGEYVICFDDDDYYPPERITHAITKMIGSKSILAGSSTIKIYYSDLNKIYEFGPFGNNHATNGTIAYNRSYILNHFYDDAALFAEEKVFLKNYTEKMIQLDNNKTILCIAHGNNTYDKKKIIMNGKLLDIKLKNIVNDKQLCDFYKQLSSQPTKN